MMTVMVNSPSRRNRAKAPAVGSHLPTLNEVIAATIDIQTKTSAMM